MPEIRKGSVGDFIRGADTWLHGQQMLIFSLTWLVFLGIVVSAIATFVYVGLLVSNCDLNNAGVYYWSHLKSLTQPFSQVFIGECSPIVGVGVLPSAVIIKEPLFKDVASFVTGELWWSFFVSFIAYSPLGAYLAVKATRRGKEIKEDKYIRGARLLSADELRSEVIKKHGISNLTIGSFPLPSGFSKKHTLICGTTGAGKSTALIHLLKAIRARGERAVIYDKKGEFIEMFYRDNIDHILNPSDNRSHQWSPWEEMASPFDADWIAETLFPNTTNSGGNEKFFINAARNTVSAALQTLYLDGPRSLLSLLQATAWNDIELLRSLVAGTPAEAYFNADNERTLESIRSTIVDGIRPFRLLMEDDTRGFFSIRDWIEQGDAPDADDSWLFLPVRESDIEIQKPLISTWIQSVAKGLMARGVDNDRILWLIIDELPSLKKIPALSSLMAEGRGFGAAVVLGIQEINQLEEEFGKNVSRTILGLCSTHLHFRLNNADTAEWVSKVMGDAEREEIDEDLNYSSDDIRDGVRVSSKRQSRKIVLPSEIMDLPDLSCFVKVWGVEAKALINVPFLRLPKITDGFVHADESKSVGMRLLSMARANQAMPEGGFVTTGQSPSTALEAVNESPDSTENGNQVQTVESVLESAGMNDDYLFDLLGGKKS